ncbi:MAG TPA: 3-methyl-2-oxobutanoate hydroxymethyltransferase [Terriglobia bacterium]|nr:3-methyl-2-oxobutanoate hydroxymethyltransferase [Terriglobia bacterium]
MKPLRIPDLRQMKTRGEKITVLTAYDFSMARFLDRAGIDVILVGDSAGMVVLGFDTTIPVTLDMMIHHTAAVSRGAKRAIVVGDMPFLTYHASLEDAVRNAGRFIQEGGAAAVKIEGGRPMAPVVERLTQIGIPVVGHLGLTPQSVHALGGFRPQGRDEKAAAGLMADAKAIEEAGAAAVVLESIPAELGRQVSASLTIPTIGIGAGPYCDGQVLVSHDVFGLVDGPSPPFARQYAKLGEAMTSAAEAYIADVRAGRFPPAPSGEPKKS